MNNDISKAEIIKILRRQYLAFLILLIAVFGGFLYLSNQIIELQHDVRTLQHEVDYLKGRVESNE